MSLERLAPATAIHVCTTHSRSGIADYAREFHQHVLEPLGYALADPREVISSVDRLDRQTRFHVQLGVFQHAERLAMSNLMRRGFINIDATVHDPPFLTFPFHQFQSRFLMRLSRGFDWYLGSFGAQRRALERLNRVFVLSHVGHSAIVRMAPKADVTVIPHLIGPDRVWTETRSLGEDLLYFGHIGAGKGLDYTLRLHRLVRRTRPQTHLHVVGDASSSEDARYLAHLRAEFQDGVTFHGYVPEENLDALFERAGHVILPYARYKYIMPASGSAIQALRRARIVWTSRVNAMPELIRDGENGFMLAMDEEVDAARLAAVLDDTALMHTISQEARRTAVQIADFPFRQHFIG